MGCGNARHQDQDAPLMTRANALDQGVRRPRRSASPSRDRTAARTAAARRCAGAGGAAVACGDEPASENVAPIGPGGRGARRRRFARTHLHPQAEADGRSETLARRNRRVCGRANSPPSGRICTKRERTDAVARDGERARARRAAARRSTSSHATSAQWWRPYMLFQITPRGDGVLSFDWRVARADA